jgi:hypothetical protein
MLVAALLPVMLAACYTSQTPLIPAGAPVFPYQTISYTQSTDDKIQTLTLKGDQYTATDAKGAVTELRFKLVSGNFYVAQMHFTSGSDQLYLYGLLKIDIMAKTASAWGLVADKGDISPTLPACPGASDSICLTSLDAYVQHAMAKANASAKPEAVYRITDLK